MIKITRKSTKEAKRAVKLVSVIEAKTYPKYMRQLSGRVSQFLDYIEEDEGYILLLGKDGYVICTQSEVVDWVGGSSHTEVFRMFRELKKFYGERRFSVDLREGSLKVIEALIQKGRLIEYYRSSWLWEDEVMVEMEVSIPH